jgi:hypothetical protein
MKAVHCPNLIARSVEERGFMCAASASAPNPLYDEGKQYWMDLTNECKRYVECVNAALGQHGIGADGFVTCAPGEESLEIFRARYPSTHVKLTLNFLSWGPVISATITGQQREGKVFLPQELELPIAIDLDSRTVAIYDEGRSFSPHEVASYFTQYFHRCYPLISLPC